MDKVYVKYNAETFEVEAFLLENEIQDNDNYILIDKTKESELIELTNENGGTLFVKDVDKKEFESIVIPLRKAYLLEQESETDILKREVAEMKEQLNSILTFMNELKEAETLK